MDIKQIYKDIGERIRIRRTELKMTQGELSVKLGVSPSYLSHIESGNRNVSLDILVSASNVLEISVEYLIFGTHPANKGSKEVYKYNLLNKLERLFDKPNGEQLRKVVQVLADNFDKF